MIVVAFDGMENTDYREISKKFKRHLEDKCMRVKLISFPNYETDIGKRINELENRSMVSVSDELRGLYYDNLWETLVEINEYSGDFLIFEGYLFIDFMKQSHLSSDMLSYLWNSVKEFINPILEKRGIKNITVDYGGTVRENIYELFVPSLHVLLRKEPVIKQEDNKSLVRQNYMLELMEGMMSKGAVELYEGSNISLMIDRGVDNTDIDNLMNLITTGRGKIPHYLTDLGEMRYRLLIQ